MAEPDTSIFIPRTLTSAEKVLNDIGGLVTAKEWHRAALVYAFTRPSKGGRPSGNRIAADAVSIREFAAKGVIGLKSQNTIRRYREAWEATGREAAPGRKVNLDGLPEWETVFDASDSGGRPRAPMAEITKRAEKDPEYADRLIEEVTKVRPEVITSTRIARAVTKSPGMAEKVLRESPAAGRAFGQAQVTGWEQAQRNAGIEPDQRDAEHGYLIASGLITAARGKVRDALKEIVAINVGRNQQEDLLHGVHLLENAVSMLRSAIETGDKTFEDEVANLLHEKGK